LNYENGTFIVDVADLPTRFGFVVKRSHEVFIGSWDAFTATWSITNDATSTDAFTDIKPK